jgi:hypothetical protein
MSSEKKRREEFVRAALQGVVAAHANTLWSNFLQNGVAPAEFFARSAIEIADAAIRALDASVKEKAE